MVSAILVVAISLVLPIAISQADNHACPLTILPTFVTAGVVTGLVEDRREIAKINTSIFQKILIEMRGSLREGYSNVV